MIRNMDQWLPLITQIDSEEQAKEFLTEFSRVKAFNAFAYLVFNPQCSTPESAFTINNYHAEWAEVYARKQYYKHDPILRLVLTSTCSFVWDETIDFTTLTEKNFFVMHEAKKYQIENGLTIPLNIRNGTSINFLFPGKIDQATKKETMMVAHLIHERIQELNLHTHKKALSARETECLIWSAAGKTSEEISIILNISTRTVNEHIKNGMHKLNASNKTHAIIKALLQEEITFSDIPA